MTESAGGTNAPAVRIVELDSTLKTLRQTNIVFSKGSNAWAQKSIIINTTSNTSFAYVYANIWNGYGTFRVDDVEVREIVADAPVITSVVLSNVVLNTGASITVTVKATDNTAVTGVTANGTVLQYITSSNVWEGTIIAQAGTHSINVSAKDAAGNIAWNNSTSYTATPDTTKPVITSVVLNNVVVNTGASITVTVKATDNTAVTGVTANGTVLQYITSSNVWRGTIIAQAGTHSVMVSAKDAAGNIAWNNSTSYTATTPDTTKPVINSITLSNITPYSGAAIIITVNATDNVGVTVVTANGTALTNLSDNIWSGTIIAESGNHYVKVSAKDAAGNVAWNNTTGYIATTPPDTTAAVISISPSSASVTSGQTQQFTAIGYDAKGNTTAITPTWKSSNTTVGTIDIFGSFAALHEGTTTITATSGAVSANATITVTSADSQITPNLISNPGFETGTITPINWTFVTNNGSTPSWDANVSHTGSRSIKIQVTGTKDNISGYPKSDLSNSFPTPPTISQHGA